MCFEERFFIERTAKRAVQREKPKAESMRESAPRAEPVQPAPETRRQKEAERETENV